DVGRRPLLEGYSWGGLTSAARLRALWVLLTPFALANLAGWMVRHGGRAAQVAVRSRTARDSVLSALIRLFGLVLTLSVTGFVAVGAIDLISYQCGSRLACTDGRWWLSPWENGLVDGHLGRSLVVGAVVPVAVIFLLAWLARRSQLAIHDRVDFTARSDPAYRLNLNHPDLWRSPHVAHRLGLTHTAGALTAISVTLASVAHHVGVVDGSAVLMAGWILMVLCGTAVLRLEGVASPVHIFLLGAAITLWLSTAVLVWLGEEVGPRPGIAPGARVLVRVLLPSYAVLALCLGVAAFVAWRREGRGSVRAALMAPLLLVVAAGLIGAFGSGLMIRLADLLGSPVAEGGGGAGVAVSQPPIYYAAEVSDAAVITLLTLIVLVLVVGAFWSRIGPGPNCEQLASRFVERGGLDCEDAEDRDWARGVARAEAEAALTDRSAAILGVVVVIVLVVVAAALLTAGDSSGMGLGPWADRVARPASVVLGLLPILAVFGISRLYRSRAVRRVVGIVWDVTTFWPRWFHPWCPPAYGERAIPQLRDRLVTLTGNGKVIVSAHSQGSVLAVATILQSSTEVSSSVALLTYGSPLTRLYARYFPEYCSPNLYREVATRVTRWTNLWRRTDFIGGPLETEGVSDVEVLDPVSTRPPAPGQSRPLPLRHSDYELTPEYEAALTG
ncbi:MAG: hypothetical protein WB239_03370, partial [Acidimicrobiia bacterium]